MNADEINAELLECARYGESEDLAQLLQQPGANVDFVDSFSGNTALHRAAANGEVECIRVLKAHNAQRLSNLSGNFPEHWAAQNGKTAALELLFQEYPEIDVLAKNNFGRSVLTEAFQSKETDTIALCLNHPTAEEERLIPDRNKNTTTATTTNSADGGDTATTVFKCTQGSEDAKMDVEKENDVDNAVLHDFLFAPEATEMSEGVTTAVRCAVRELPIDRADTPFGSDATPADDTTGLAIWPASILLSHWLIEELTPAMAADVAQGELTMLELGAGCGLPGLVAALQAKSFPCPSTVYITDIHSNSIENCRHNVLLNGYTETSSVPAPVANLPATTTYTLDNSSVVVQYMGWNEPATYPTAHRQMDIIIGSDLVYEIRILDYLIPTIRALLKLNGFFYYIAPEEGRQGMVEFLAALNSENGLNSNSASADSSKLVLVSQTDCPERYHQNPFAPADANTLAGSSTSGVDRDDAYVLHFYDLAAKQKHILYKFQKIE